MNGRKLKCLVYPKALQIKQLKPCEGKRPIALSGYLCAQGGSNTKMEKRKMETGRLSLPNTEPAVELVS